MSPVLWAMPGDEWEGGHVRIEGEHVTTLNYQTQARAPAFASFHQLSKRIVLVKISYFTWYWSLISLFVVFRWMMMMITWHPPLSWHNHEPSLVCIPPDDDNNDDDFDDVCIADDDKSDLVISTLIILPIAFLIVRIIVLNKFPFIWFLVPQLTVGHPPLQSPLIESLVWENSNYYNFSLTCFVS